MASSRNLVAFAGRERDSARATVLQRLEDKLAARGELVSDDIRAVAAESGMPEAFVHGISTFYDDLLVPRGKRHIRVCTGTACHVASGGDGHVEQLAHGLGVEPGSVSEDGEVSLTKTVCLGYCHSSPAVQDGAHIVAGTDAVAQICAGPTVATAEPEARSILPEPALVGGHEPWSGLRRALESFSPEQLIDEVEQAGLTGRGGAAFSTGRKWRFTAGAQDKTGRGKAIVCNGDEGDAGSYIDKFLMEQSPNLLIEGMAIAGYAVGANEGFILVRSEYPDSAPALEAAIAIAEDRGLLGENILGTDFSFTITVITGAGSYVVGEETALIACIEGTRGTVSARPPFPANSGVYGMPTVVNNVETLCNAPVIAARGAVAYQNLSPNSPSAGSKLVCFNERFVSPGVVEVPFGITVRELCEEIAGGMRDGRELVAVQMGGPLGGILPASLLDTPFDLHTLPEHGCMVGHGSILAFDDTTDMRAIGTHLLEFGAEESCGKCFPCRIGLHRGHEMFAASGPIDSERLDALLTTLEVASLCAHGGGMSAPIRSLIKHFPQEIGLS